MFRMNDSKGSLTFAHCRNVCTLMLILVLLSAVFFPHIALYADDDAAGTAAGTNPDQQTQLNPESPSPAADGSSGSAVPVVSDGILAQTDDDAESGFPEDIDDSPAPDTAADIVIREGFIRGGYKKKKANAKPGAPLYVMIGDSYGTTKDHLAVSVAEDLGLKAAGGDYYAFFKGGYGTSKSHGRTYLTLLSKLPDSSAVTDVLFCGGIYNDRRFKKEVITKRITQTIEEARRKYPNARIMYAIGNWHSNDYHLYTRPRARRYQKLVLTRISWYKEACRKNGVYFLKNVEKTLRLKNNQQYFRGDGHHPSKLGIEKLSKAVARSIRHLNKSTKVQAVSLNHRSLSLKPGNTAQLTAKVKAKKKCVTKKVVFVSTKPSVCRVDSETGTLTAVGRGNCKVYCKAFDGSGKYDVCEIHVQ